MLQLPTIRTLVSNISCGCIDHHLPSFLTPLPFPCLGYRLQYIIQVLDGTGSSNILSKKLWIVKNSVVLQNWMEELVISHHKTTH